MSTSDRGRRAQMRREPNIKPQIDCRTFECVRSFVMAESEWLFGGFTGA